MKLLPIGTKVFDINHGWGKITGKNVEYYSVQWDNVSGFFKISDGTFKGVSNKFPALSLTEYTLEKGGFTPITEYGKPKAGDLGYFWDNFIDGVGFAKLTKIHKNCYFIYEDHKGYIFKNFSHEIPQDYLNYLKTK